MALDAPQVRVGITGQLYKAALGSPEPTTSTSVLDSAYVGLGYFNDEGTTESWSDSVDNIVAWQGATVVRSSVTESVGTLSFTPIQTNAAVLQAFHRGSTITEPTAGNFRMEVKPIEADPSTWVFDAIDGSKHIRIWVPNASVTERGDVVYANGEPIGYPMTITFYPDANGNLLVKHSDDAAWDPTP